MFGVRFLASGSYIHHLRQKFMDIIFLGHAAFKLKGKQTSLVTDPYDTSVGLKFPKVDADIVTVSHGHGDHNAKDLVSGDPFVIDGPGEYEIKGVKIIGVASFHDEKEGKERGLNTIYNIKIDGINVCHMGDFGQKSLTSEQQEVLGNVDVLLVPTGGVYTIDAQAAAEISASLEPKIVIPMHFLDQESTIKIDPVEKFLKEIGSEVVKPEPKLSITRDRFPAEQSVVLLEKKS